MKLLDYLKSKTVWGAVLVSVAPYCGAYAELVRSAGIALAGVGVKSAISGKGNSEAK